MGSHVRGRIKLMLFLAHNVKCMRVCREIPESNYSTSTLRRY